MATKRDPLPSYKAVARYWQGQHKFGIVDTEELSCFRCGYFCQTSTKSQGLVRAHLLAHISGGTEDVSNIVLLCDSCHRVQPDHDAEEAMAWVEAGDALNIGPLAGMLSGLLSVAHLTRAVDRAPVARMRALEILRSVQDGNQA